MNFSDILKRAVEVRELYDTSNTTKFGKPWSRLELAQGFVGDVGDLTKIVMAKEGLRDMENIDEKLQHELADCLWSVMVLSDKYGVDLEQSFLQTMDVLEKRITGRE